MLTHYYQSSQFIEQLRNGPAGAQLDPFAQALHNAGYACISARRHLRAAQHFVYWSESKGVALDELDDNAIERFEHHLPRCRCRAYGRSDRSLVKGARLFVAHIQGDNIVDTPCCKPARQSPSALLVAFQNWMHKNRPVSDAVLSNYSHNIAELLQTLGEDPQRFDARGLRTFVLERSQQCGICKAKMMVTALRAFVRFLVAEGHCPSGLQAAIPGIAHWHLADLPRYLQPEAVERVIGACDPGTAVGLRDRAIVLVLARLALRAGDVVALRLGDIDWTGAALRVVGKGRRETHLPLSQEVGDALVAYLTEARPKTACEQLFVRSRAPFRGFAGHAAVSVIVARAMDRAGVVPTTRGAAHLLRHSAATRMLNQGASLYDIAAVLRHRSTETTTIYAKVDSRALAQIAQPWPEALSC